MQAERPRLQRKYPLLFHLMLLVVTCVLPVVGFSAMLMDRIVEEQWRLTEGQLDSSARALVAAADHEIEHELSVLAALAASAELQQGDLAGFHAGAAAAFARQRGAEILLADLQGNQLLNTAYPFATPLPHLGDPDAARRAAETREPQVTGLFQSTAEPGWHYAILTPVERDGQVPYVLAMTFTPQGLADALGFQQVPPEWTVELLDRRGRIMWRSRDAARHVGTQSGPAFLARLDGPPSGLFAGTTFDGVSAYAAISRSRMSGWSAAVGAPRSAIDAALFRSLSGVFGAGTFMLLFGILLSSVLGRRLQVSVGQLIAAAKALGRGEERPPVSSSVRELAAIGDALSDAGRVLASEHARRDTAEASLRHSEASLADAQRIAGLGSWEWDAATGAFTWSAAMFALFKIAPGSIVPSRSGLVALVHPQDRAKAVAWLAMVTQQGATPGTELRIVRPDGETRVVNCESEPVRDESGALLRIAGTIQDITERKHIEEELARAKSDAEQANRAKSDFLANMSHELRTPLNAVIGFADVIEHQRLGPSAAAKYAEYAAHIRQSGEHLLDLITDVLDFAKLDAGRVILEEDLVEAPALAASCVAGAEPQAHAAGLRLVSTIEPDIGALRCDRCRLEQVLSNLLENAVKFTPAGGRIGLRMAIERDGCLLIEVSDTGIGIAGRDLPLVLQPFGRLDSALSRRTQGAGLGLPLTKHLVELHGGTLSLDSTPGVGTRAIIRLPAERVLREVA
jgi:signal transduction histidine kinase